MKTVKGLALTIALAIGGLSAEAQTLAMANGLVEKEKFNDAKNMYTALTASMPIDAYYGLGKLFVMQGNLDSAKICFEKSAAINPKRPLGKVGLAWLETLNGNSSAASAMIDQNASVVKKDVRYWSEAGLAMFENAKSGNLNQARVYFDKAAALTQSTPNFEFNIAMSKFYLNFPDSGGQVVRYLERAKEMQPTNPYPCYLLGQLYVRSMNFDVARKNFEDAVNLEAQFGPAYRGIAEMEIRRKPKPNYSAAAENFGTYLSLSDASVEMMTRYAAILFLNDNLDGAAREIERIRSIDASSIYLIRMKGYTNYKKGFNEKDQMVAGTFYNDAIRDLTDFLTKVPADKVRIDDYEYLGRAALRTGKADIALSNYEKAVQLDSTIGERLFSEAGDSLYRMKIYGKAAKAYEARLKYIKTIQPSDYYRLGLCYFNSKDYEKADTTFQRLIDARPDNYLGYQWRAKTNAVVDTAYKLGVAVDFYKKYLGVMDTISADKAKFKKDIMGANEYLMVYSFKNDDLVNAKEYAKRILVLDSSNVNASRILNYNPTPVKATPGKPATGGKPAPAGGPAATKPATGGAAATKPATGAAATKPAAGAKPTTGKSTPAKPTNKPAAEGSDPSSTTK